MIEAAAETLSATGCQPGNISILYFLFRECAYSWIDGSAVIFGYISILCWLNVLFPQLWENYKTKSVESLSYGFLAIWFIGDVANLIGGVLTNQQTFQIFLAGYFVVMDLATVLQCLYYNFVYHRRRRSSNALESLGLMTNCSTSNISSGTVFDRKKLRSYLTVLSMMSSFMGLCILFDVPSMKPQALGALISWTCTFLYVGSRMPQIYKNWKRQSVAGLSIHMFAFAFFGNFFYTLSILGRCYQDHSLFFNALPFLLGSAGTMWEDGILFYQFKMYRVMPLISNEPLGASGSARSSYCSLSSSNRVHPAAAIPAATSKLASSDHGQGATPSSVTSLFQMPFSFYSSTPIQMHHRRASNVPRFEKDPNNSP